MTPSTPIQLHQRLCGARERRHAVPAPDRPRHRRSGRQGRPAVQAEASIHKLERRRHILKTMRLAARNVVLVRHTYNLVDLPIVVAGKSGTAEFGLRDSKGRLPFHSWFVAFVPKNPARPRPIRAGSRRLRRTEPRGARFCLRLADEGQRRDGDREDLPPVSLHIQKDYLLPNILRRGNFYGSTRAAMGIATARAVRAGAGPPRRLAPSGAPSTCRWPSTPRCSRASGWRWRTATPRAGRSILAGGSVFLRGLMWAGIALVVFIGRDRLRLPLAQDLRLAALRRPARAARLTLVIGTASAVLAVGLDRACSSSSARSRRSS